jgi:urea transport system substrate-binding protein
LSKFDEQAGQRRRQALGATQTTYTHDQQNLCVPSSPRGVKDTDIDEKYTRFQYSDYQTIVADIKAANRCAQTAVISTINGDSNVPFYKESSTPA